MHDIDRTQLELDPEADFEYDELSSLDTEGVFDEATEMELAAELLAVADEAELDQFLGNLIKRVGRTIGRAVRSPVGRTLGGMLRGVVKRALPVVGGALGSFVAPGIGTAAGSALAQSAGRMFGLELEGLSSEDQEFEVSRRVVRLAGDAVRTATTMPASDPAATAVTALTQAANRHAPGLSGQLAGAASRHAASPVCRCHGAQQGRWVRRGRNVVLLSM